MQILLIEDDNFKRELVEETLHRARDDIVLTVGRSVQQAVRLINQKIYDLIILDMALPSHESRAGGAQPISLLSGGTEVLLELSYDNRRDKVVIVTQYPEIEFDGRFYPLSKAKGAFVRLLSANIVDVIHFNIQNARWREQLVEVVT